MRTQGRLQCWAHYFFKCHKSLLRSSLSLPAIAQGARLQWLAFYRVVDETAHHLVVSGLAEADCPGRVGIVFILRRIIEVTGDDLKKIGATSFVNVTPFADGFASFARLAGSAKSAAAAAQRTVTRMIMRAFFISFQPPYVLK
jgi:hypothetical protein